MNECVDSLASIRSAIDKLDEYIKSMIDEVEKFNSTHSNGCTKEVSNSFIAKIAQGYATTLNICKKRISTEYPIVIATHIEAIRLMEEILLSTKSNSQPILSLLLTNMLEERKQIETNISLLNEVSKRFSNNGMLKNTTSYSAERSFALIIDDYAANLNTLYGIIDTLVNKIKK